MIVEYTVPEAQLVASLLNTHKSQTETASGLAGSALDKIVEASKQDIENETEEMENE